MHSDGSDRWQRHRAPGWCNKILESRTSSCCQRSLLSPFSLVLHFVTDSRMFWVFGSLFQRRCGVFLASCCGSGNQFPLQSLRRPSYQLLRQRRDGADLKDEFERLERREVEVLSFA